LGLNFVDEGDLSENLKEFERVMVRDLKIL
jgi:hypothetical protein